MLELKKRSRDQSSRHFILCRTLYPIQNILFHPEHSIPSRSQVMLQIYIYKMALEEIHLNNNNKNRTCHAIGENLTLKKYSNIGGSHQCLVEVANTETFLLLEMTDWDNTEPGGHQTGQIWDLLWKTSGFAASTRPNSRFATVALHI